MVDSEVPPDAPTGGITETDATSTLRAEGYTGSFSVDGGGVRCDACGTVHPVTDAVVERVIREEGASDPSDEAIVLGLRCHVCGTAGTLISAYGPEASPEEAEVLRSLPDIR